MNNAHNVLTKIGACQPAVLWSAGQLSCESAWLNCERSDWMLWLIRKLDCVELNFYKRYACFCARQNWDNMKDQRSKDGIIAAERYIEGAISRKEMLEARSAAAAAYAAAHAAYAAAHAAAAAAYAAAHAAYAAAHAAAHAAYAAAHAAYAAAHAADADAADAYAYADAAAHAADACAAYAVGKEQCNYIRMHVEFASVIDHITEYRRQDEQ